MYKWFLKPCCVSSVYSPVAYHQSCLGKSCCYNLLAHSSQTILCGFRWAQDSPGNELFYLLSTALLHPMLLPLPIHPLLPLPQPPPRPRDQASWPRWPPLLLGWQLALLLVMSWAVPSLEHLVGEAAAAQSRPSLHIRWVGQVDACRRGLIVSRSSIPVPWTPQSHQ